MLKNVAGQRVGAQLVSATDGSAFTGSVTVAVTVDAGTQATGSVGSGACTHEGGGYHTYAPAQAETNGDLLAFTFSGTGAVPVTVQIYTLPTTGVLAPTTAGRTLTVEADGMAHADVKEINASATAAANASNAYAGLIAHAGTAQAGASTTITLASGASSTDDFYNSAAVGIVSGTGAGQTRKITDYTGSTRVAAVDTAWVTNPDNTSVYQVLGRIV